MVDTIECIAAAGTAYSEQNVAYEVSAIDKKIVVEAGYEKICSTCRNK